MFGWFEKGGCPKKINVEWSSMIFGPTQSLTRSYTAEVIITFRMWAHHEKRMCKVAEIVLLWTYVTPIYILLNLETAELYYNVIQINLDEQRKLTRAGLEPATSGLTCRGSTN